MHHSGWPWPLDALQDWFEDLWDWISEAASAAASWLWDTVSAALESLGQGLTDLITWVATHVSEAVNWLWDTVSAALESLGRGLTDSINAVASWISEGVSWLWDTVRAALESLGRGLTETINSVWTSIRDFFGWLGEQLSEVGGWLSGVIWGWVDGALSWLTDTFTWLRDEMIGGLDWVVGSVRDAFSEILHNLMAGIGTVFERLIDAVVDFSNAVADFFAGINWGAALDVLLDLFSGISDVFAGFFAAHSPITPKDARPAGRDWRGLMDNQFQAWAQGTLYAEAASMGQLDIALSHAMYVPKMRAASDLAVDLYKKEMEASLVIPFNQGMMASYTPMLPPVVDLIRFVVREVITPERFYEIMPFLGFRHSWAEAYWEAHFVLPAPSVLYDAYHRGAITSEELDKFIFWHDYKSKPRPGISKSDIAIMRSTLKRLIPRVDIRYAWETGLISDEELEAWYSQLGYEEDAPLMAAIQKVRALTEEIHKVRDEWLRDLIEGYITENVAHANLAAIGIGPTRIDYYISYATLRREREMTGDLLSLYQDSYIKDLISDEEFEARVYELIVIPEVADLYINRAYTRKYKKPSPPRETEEEKAEKEANKYRISYARELYRRYAISKEEFVTLLEAAGVAPAVAAARANYEALKLPLPKPSDEEISRRQEAARVQSLEVSAAIEEYRRFIIDESELLRRLQDVGLSEAMATARAQLEMIRRPAPPVPPEEIERARLEARVQDLQARTLVEQYRRYTIEKDELIAGLIAAGLDPAEAGARADYEEARRPAVKPTAEERAAAKEEALIRRVQERIAKREYKRYLIEAEELKLRLMNLDYSEEAADAAVALETLLRPAPKPSEEEIITARETTRATRLSEGTAVTEYVKGLISEAELRDRLAALEYGRGLIEAIVARAIVRKYKPPTPPKAPVVKEASVSTLLRAFRLGLIPETDLFDELIRRGYNAVSARLMVDVEVTKLG